MPRIHEPRALPGLLEACFFEETLGKLVRYIVPDPDKPDVMVCIDDVGQDAKIVRHWKLMYCPEITALLRNGNGVMSQQLLSALRRQGMEHVNKGMLGCLERSIAQNPELTLFQLQQTHLERIIRDAVRGGQHRFMRLDAGRIPANKLPPVPEPQLVSAVNVLRGNLLGLCMPKVQEQDEALMELFCERMPELVYPLRAGLLEKNMTALAALSILALNIRWDPAVNDRVRQYLQRVEPAAPPEPETPPEPQAPPESETGRRKSDTAKRKRIVGAVLQELNEQNRQRAAVEKHDHCVRVLRSGIAEYCTAVTPDAVLIAGATIRRGVRTYLKLLKSCRNDPEILRLLWPDYDEDGEWSEFLLQRLDDLQREIDMAAKHALEQSRERELQALVAEDFSILRSWIAAVQRLEVGISLAQEQQNQAARTDLEEYQRQIERDMNDRDLKLTTALSGLSRRRENDRTLL